MGYFGLSQLKSLFAELDKWIRRRVRACVWKQWRLPRTRVRKLRALGVRQDEAHSHGNSRKGPWRLAKSLGIHLGMTNQWLEDQGLISLNTLWHKLAPKRRTA